MLSAALVAVIIPKSHLTSLVDLEGLPKIPKFPMQPPLVANSLADLAGVLGFLRTHPEKWLLDLSNKRVPVAIMLHEVRQSY